mgnify:FL=1
MNLIIYFLSFNSFIIDNFSNKELRYDKIIEEEFVYLCNKPGEKCYYTIPCKILRDSCNDVNGKIFKVPLSRAVQMKREKCECQEGIEN